VRVLVPAGQPQRRHRAVRERHAAADLDVPAVDQPADEARLLLAHAQAGSEGLWAPLAPERAGPVGGGDRRGAQRRLVGVTAPQTLVRRHLQHEAVAGQPVARGVLGARGPRRQVRGQPPRTVEVVAGEGVDDLVAHQPTWGWGWVYPVSLARWNERRISASASSRPTQCAPSTDLPGSRSL